MSSGSEAWHVVRTLRALEPLALGPRSAPVRTARRILKRLASEGYVALGDDRRRRYRSRWSPAGPGGEECHLCVPSHLSALCLVHATGEAPGRCRPQLRELVPCHCTATGKALLAWRSAWRDAVLGQPLRSFTERTTTGPEWLRRELGRTIARGFAVEDREFQAETRGVAVPVFSGSDEAVAALGIVAPVDRPPVDRQYEVAEAASRAAGLLSAEVAPTAG